MAWKFDSDRPIYTQLLEQIKLGIVSNQYLPGDKLPSVRDFAFIAGVNPNTMQRALSQLEQQGIIFTNRTEGKYITTDTNLITQMRESIAKEQVHTFCEKMRKLNYSTSEILSLLSDVLKEEEV